MSVTFDLQLFLLLFMPPLLFFMRCRSILLLVFGIVFMTVLAVGYFGHALVPTVLLPVAFALAVL